MISWNGRDRFPNRKPHTKELWEYNLIFVNGQSMTLFFNTRHDDRNLFGHHVSGKCPGKTEQQYYFFNLTISVTRAALFQHFSLATLQSDTKV